VPAALDPAQAVLRANPLWHATDPEQIRQVRFRQIDTPQVALASYVAGELDSIPVPEVLIPQVNEDPTLSAQLHEAPDGSFWLTKPWLTRAYPQEPGSLPLESIHTWRLDWAAKQAAQ
jgi:ABC-type transport system substrate-binding protein